MKNSIQASITKTILTAFLIAATINIYGQYFVFSDYGNIPTIQNSAFVGNECSPRISLYGQSIIRNNILNPTYRTAGLNFDMPFKLKKDYVIGAGYRYYNDISGTTLGLMGHALAVSLSKKINASNASHILSIGLEGSINQRTLNDNDLRWPSQITGNGFDPTLPSGEPAFDQDVLYGDVNLGASWTTILANKTKMMIGASFNHINKPNISFLNNETRLNILSNFHVKAETPITDKIKLLPSAYFITQGPQDTYNISLATKYKAKDNLSLVGGIGYNKNGQPLIIAGVEFPKLAIGFNYNFKNQAEMHKYEATVSYRFRKCD